MAKLISEYTDTKNIKHSVEHVTLPAGEDTNGERIIEDILNVLLRKCKAIHV